MMMIRIAIVDDDEECGAQEKEFIRRYAEETGEKFEIDLYKSGMDFISDYTPIYDVVFLDIEMPLLTGMETARRLRRLDGKVCIVFITKMSKYAIEGYEVNAIDFVVKPIKYANFIDKLKKAISFINSHKEKEIVVKSEDKYILIPVSDIYYIMKDRNYLIYYTAKGKIAERGTMKKVEEDLAGNGFSVCNSGCMVNLKHIQQVTQNCVVINGEQIPLSRRKIRDFKKEMLSYLRGGKS